MDPPRPECIDAISVAHKAGVRVAMITGDHKDTALAIGSNLGLVDQKNSDAITGPELDNLSEAEMAVAELKRPLLCRSTTSSLVLLLRTRLRS